MMELVLIATAIFCLLVVSALFSGSETALTAVSRARMHQLEEEGDRRAATVNRLIEDPERLIGSILIGNNLVNILSSALTTSLFIGLFGSAGVFMATALMTVIVVIFAEVMPKTFAINNAERAALLVAPLMRVIISVFSPFARLVVGIANGLLKVCGVRTGENPVSSAYEEIRGAINLHHKKEAIVKKDKDMLAGILDLSRLELSDLMVHRTQMVSLDADDPPNILLDAILKSSFSRLPVWREDPDNIIGVIHYKDVLNSCYQNRCDIEKLDIPALAREAWFVPETRSVQDQLSAFLRNKKHFALVVDEYGAVQGLVTLEDILEEIVGEIQDEYDETSSGIRPASDGSVYIDGDTPIRDINRHLEWNLPEDGPTTLAGLIIEAARTIPEPGDIFHFYGFRFQVMRKKRNVLVSIRVTPVDREHEKNREKKAATHS